MNKASNQTIQTWGTEAEVSEVFCHGQRIYPPFEMEQNFRDCSRNCPSNVIKPEVIKNNGGQPVDF